MSNTIDTDRHDRLRTMGKFAGRDASLWVHSNGDPSNYRFIVCVECAGKEWDFRNVTDAWLFFWEEQVRQGYYVRARRNAQQRKRYWNKHTFSM